MATLLTKGLIVAGGLAGASATGGGIYYLTSTKENTSDKQNEKSPTPITTQAVTKNKTISSLLKNKKLLTNIDGDNLNWDASLKLFEKDHTSKTPAAPWEFTNWKVAAAGTSNLASFKQQCLKLNQEKVSGEDDPVYITVEKYCTKEEGVKQAGDV